MRSEKNISNAKRNIYKNNIPPVIAFGTVEYDCLQCGYAAIR